jgi:succinate-semialdehyde dehydrogenase/glutarate-semialdehyde dehydrogenase
MPAAAARIEPAALPPRLTPERLSALADRATYAEGVAGRDALRVVAPFTGAAVAALPAGVPEDVAEAFRRARRAQPAWAARPVAERAHVLRRLHDLVFERAEEGMDLVQLEAGKARLDAFLEVGDVAVVARYYGYHGEAALARRGAAGFVPFLSRVEVNRLPVGTVGIIAPWNYPLTMAITDALPALLAGNAVVVKPAEQTPLSALWAATLLDQAGLPRDLLHVVVGDGPTLGPTLIAGADFVHFTGSTEVGRLVAAQAAERLVGASLELGGKNPMVVLDDADPEEAAQGAIAACFSSAGQLCVSTERLYVPRAQRAAFLAAFREKAGTLRVGPGYGWDTDMGTLASPEQLDKVTAHVADAVAKGATVVTGGRPLPHLGPFFYAPTILTDVTPDMALYAEETFGPVVAVYPYDSDDEAVALANDSPYGLNAVVWTRDAARGRALARRLRFGTVGVNDAYVAAWGSTGAPMGGFGQSGQGRRHGPEGLTKYTEAQTVAVQRLIPLAPFGGMTAEAFAGVALKGLRLLRRLPGLR